MQLRRTNSAIALIAALSLLSGCADKPHTQTSNPQAPNDQPNRAVSSDYQQILSETRNIVAKQLNLGASDIDVDVSLSKQKVPADELDVIEIIMGVEETFGIEIKDEEVSAPDGQLRDDLSARQLVHLVLNKKGKK